MHEIGTAMRSQIERIEKKRDSTALVLAATNLEMDIIPALYDTLRECGTTNRLDVVLYSRGGIVTAARRIALLLHEFSSHICFIVPYCCESSATIIVLAGHEIIAGPVASFSPVDPHLQSDQSASSAEPNAISVQNIRLFARMCQDWFGTSESEGKSTSLSVMCSNFFPATLTAFYRSTLEAQEVCNELLTLSMSDEPADVRAGIVDKLLFGYHSHEFSLRRQDLSALGLPVRRDDDLENIAWTMARELQQSVGIGNRVSEDDDWVSAVLATRTVTRRQRRRAGSLPPRWEVCETE